MTIDLSVHMDSDKARAALAKLSGKQAIHAETGEPFAEVKDGSEEAKN